jgi:hypothetical protein
MSGNPTDEVKQPAFVPQKKPWWYMSAKQIGVAAAFAGMALAITLAHIVVPIPGVPGGGGMDPSEIIRSVGSALGGPLVGAIIGIFGSVSSISNVISHIPPTVAMGLMYKYIYKTKKGVRMGLWIAAIAAYYFVFMVPFIALTTVFQYFKGDMGMFVPMLASILPGIAPEFVVTTIVTVIIWGALADKYTKPLW